MPDDRLYTEKEIAAILNRAGDLQAERDPGPAHGLSLAELQQIAAEVGLDPRLVATAALELDGAGSSPQAGAWPAIPKTVLLERIVPGELDEADWTEISEEIGRAFGVVGASGQVGRTFEWTHTAERVQLQVRLTPDRGQTRVRIFGDFSKVVAARLWVRLLWVVQAMILGVGWPLGAGVSGLGSAAIGLAAGLLVYLLVHFGFSAWIDRRERAARDLMNRLERKIAGRSVPQASAESSREQAGPRIALPGDEAAGTSDPAALRLRERGRS